ncbi:MAG TPA: rRNA maturation RNase YbeY [Armatimonadota bacterium]
MSHRLLRRAIEDTLRAEGVAPRAVEVSVALIDDAAMRDLNARYRGIDNPTDVLSFSQESEVTIPGAPKLLGDVVISLDTAVTQATAGNRTLDGEVTFLAIHGVLHLLGYDDATEQGYAEMARKGTEIWQRLHAATPESGHPHARSHDE